jgi:hypothetical protein
VTKTTEVTMKMKTPRLTVRWMMSSWRRKPRRVGAQVAQQMIRAQQTQRAHDAQEGEILDEHRQHERQDDDDVGQGGEAQQRRPARGFGVEAGGQFERQHDRQEEVEREHPWRVAGERRDDEDQDGDDVEGDQTVAKRRARSCSPKYRS